MATTSAALVSHNNDESFSSVRTSRAVQNFARKLTSSTSSRTKPRQNDSVVVYFPKEINKGSRRVRKSSSGGPSSSCRLYKTLVLAFVVSVCTVCVLVWMTSSIIEKRVIAKLQSQLQQRENNNDNYYNLHPRNHGFHVGRDDLQELKRRNVSGKRRRRRLRRTRHRTGRGRRGLGANRHNAVHSAVHLNIKTGSQFITDERDFLWQDRSDLYQTSTTFGYSRVTNNSIQGVKIKQRRGLFEVYSQSVLMGRSSNVHPYNCAQEVVLIRNGVRTVLMRSYITQHGLGMAIQGIQSSNGTSFWPLDSSFQYGLFVLENNDEIRVSYPSGCNHVRFSNADSHAFYFGVAKK